jgi:hypothetical protein
MVSDEKLERLARMGHCGEFALALHETFGYPLGAFLEEEILDPYDDWEGPPPYALAHVFAYLPGHPDKLVHVEGIADRLEVKQETGRWAQGPIREKSYKGRMPEFLSEWGEVNQDALALFLAYINRNRRRFLLPR